MIFNDRMMFIHIEKTGGSLMPKTFLAISATSPIVVLRPLPILKDSP